MLRAKEVAAMALKIPLRLRGVDLREEGASECISPELMELFWTSNGAISLAVLFTSESAAVAMDEAVTWSRRIAELMPGVTASEVHDELVSISDIAARASVAAEAVRMWTNGRRRASGRPFPAPRQVIGGTSGGKSMNLYAWREVVGWIRDILGTDPDEDVEYLTDAQHAALNAALACPAGTPGLAA
jgi:hypothetical protein